MKNTDSNDGKVKFEPKYLISWLICGVVMASGVFIGGNISGDPVPVAALFASPLVGLFSGGILFIIDATANYRYNLLEVRNIELVWHIYPIICPFAITFGFVIGIFKMMSRSLR